MQKATVLNKEATLLLFVQTRKRISSLALSIQDGSGLEEMIGKTRRSGFGVMVLILIIHSGIKGNQIIGTMMRIVCFLL